MYRVVGASPYTQGTSRLDKRTDDDGIQLCVSQGGKQQLCQLAATLGLWLLANNIAFPLA